jgi:Transposase DDE domain group 1
MSGMILHPRQALDHRRHPRQRPQLGGEAVCLGALAQGLDHLLLLVGIQFRFTARPRRAAQSSSSAALPSRIPTTHRVGTDLQVACDVRQRHVAVGEAARRLLAASFQELEIAVGRGGCAHRYRNSIFYKIVTVLCEIYLSFSLPVWLHRAMGLVITPLPPRRFADRPAAALVGSGNLGGRELIWRFDGGDISSDGGVLLLQKTEQRTGIIGRFAACFQDYRDARLIEHPLLDLITQRVYGLSLGYEDLNDHDELRADPLLAVALGKDDPKGTQRRRAQDRGKALAGKSTLNRLELTAPDYEGDPYQPGSSKRETKKITVDPESIDALLVDLFLEAHPQPPTQITLDIDATDDRLFGKQEGRFYHGYYRDYCYLPLYVFCGEHLLCARLRMSDIDASADSVEELAPVVARIRERWPAVRILLRGDAGFCREKLMAWCEQEGIDYVFGLAQNARLKAEIVAAMEQAAQQYQQSEKAARVFQEFLYATQETWSRERRVVAKAEHLSKGANPRFVVTSLSAERLPMQALYEELYCARGEAENRVKEQQLDLFADRTSTSKMWSNQLRLYFSSIAYVLVQSLRRLGLAGTEMAHAQCGTIRGKLLKIGAQIRVSVRRVWISLAEGCPYAGLFARVYANLETAGN